MVGDWVRHVLDRIHLQPFEVIFAFVGTLTVWKIMPAALPTNLGDNKALASAVFLLLWLACYATAHLILQFIRAAFISVQTLIRPFVLNHRGKGSVKAIIPYLDEIYARVLLRIIAHGALQFTSHQHQAKELEESGIVSRVSPSKAQSPVYTLNPKLKNNIEKQALSCVLSYKESYAKAFQGLSNEEKKIITDKTTEQA